MDNIIVSGGLVSTTSVTKKMAPIRAVTYSRLSIDDTESTSLEDQEVNCMRRCDANGYVVVDTIRENFTGMLYRERPKLTRLREMVRNRDVDVVVIHSVERLSRVPLHIAVLLEEMLNHGVTLECVTEQIDTSPIGQMVIQLLALAGQIERERLLERTNRMREKRLAEGQLGGTGTALYGYKWGDPDKVHYVLEENTAEVVALIYHMYVELRLSMRRIARDLTEKGIPTPVSLRLKKRKPRRAGGDWSPDQVARILKHPGYRGKAYARYWKGVRNEKGKVILRRTDNPIPLPDGLIPPIVTEATWERAQELMRENKLNSARNSVKPDDDLLLKHGPLRCGYCGKVATKAQFTNIVNGKSYTYVHYRCTDSNRVAKNCPSPTTIPAYSVDAAAWEYAKELLRESHKIKSALEEQMFRGIQDTREIDTLIEKTENAIARILHERREADTESYTYKLLTLDLEKEEKTLAALSDLRLGAQPMLERLERSKRETLAFLQQMDQIDLEKPTLEEKRAAIRSLGIRVKMYRPGDTEHSRYEIEVERVFVSASKSSEG